MFDRDQNTPVIEIKVNELRYTALSVFRGFIKKLLSIDCVSIIFSLWIYIHIYIERERERQREREREREILPGGKSFSKLIESILTFFQYISFNRFCPLDKWGLRHTARGSLTSIA